MRRLAALAALSAMAVLATTPAPSDLSLNAGNLTASEYATEMCVPGEASNALTILGNGNESVCQSRIMEALAQ